MPDKISLFYKRLSFFSSFKRAVDNIPQAAKISSPREARIVQTTPFALSASRNCSIRAGVQLLSGTEGMA